MGVFDYFKKEKIEERATTKRDKQREENNILSQKKLKDIFVEADNLVEQVKNNPNALRLDESSFQEVITALWSTIYNSALSTFLNSVEANYSNRNITEENYNKIKPLLLQWNEKLNKIRWVDQQHFVDFQEDLKLFSKQYPDWLKTKTIFQSFDEGVWKPFFEKYCTRTETIAKQFEDFLQRKRDKYYLMTESNYAFISPYEFEELVGEVFKRMGYQIEITSKSGDYGVDIIARDKNDVIAIQTKKYRTGNNVSNQDVQRLLGAMQLSTVKANKAILITTSDFTIQAKEQAKETPVELWNGKYFNSIILKYLGKQK